MNESTAVYLRLKNLFSVKSGQPRRASRYAKTKSGAVGSEPFTSGRDPVGLGNIVDGLTSDLGWTISLARSDLMANWRQLAGEKNAEHSYPEQITDGVLAIRCDSTAWATQLRIMRSRLLVNVEEYFPEAGITSIHFYGPDAPSWNHGPRSIPGRGPRDTYG